MDVQEPEDQLEREAEQGTSEEPAAQPEVASSADPSTGSPSGDFASQSPEPESRSESSIPADEPGPVAEETVDKQDEQRMEDEGGSPAEPAAEIEPASVPDPEPVAETEGSISSDLHPGETSVDTQESEQQSEQEPADEADEEETAEQPAAHVQVAPIADPSTGSPSGDVAEQRPAPAPRAGASAPSDLPSVDGSVEGPAWYVVHCYSGYENKVRHNLEQRIETMGMKDKIFDVVIPTQEEIEVKDGKRRTVERHIFPGYVLVNMALSEESWYVVRNTPGVTGFVGMGNQPTPLRPEEVSQIIKRMEAEAPTVKVTYKVGERVRIVDGPFNDFRGVVAEIDMERTKVRVMVSFFGRETPVELDFLQVEKA